VRRTRAAPDRDGRTEALAFLAGFSDKRPMPIRRGSVAFARFRLASAPPKDVRRWLGKALAAGAFEPIDVKGDEERAQGFVELEGAERTGFAPGDVFFGTQALFSWRVDRLKVPSAQVRAELLKWAQAFEAKNGRAPGRRERAEQKDVVKKALRSKLDPVTRTFDLSLDLKTKELFVWATSRTVIEEIHAALEERLEEKLVPLVPAAQLDPDALDALAPTPALFLEVA
jgi:recombination associated protein RdgC